MQSHKDRQFLKTSSMTGAPEELAFKHALYAFHHQTAAKFEVLLLSYSTNSLSAQLCSIIKIAKILKMSLLGGLEPPTLRLTAVRANRLRHRSPCIVIFNKIYIPYKYQA